MEFEPLPLTNFEDQVFRSIFDKSRLDRLQNNSSNRIYGISLCDFLKDEYDCVYIRTTMNYDFNKSTLDRVLKVMQNAKINNKDSLSYVDYNINSSGIMLWRADKNNDFRMYYFGNCEKQKYQRILKIILKK